MTDSTEVRIVNEATGGEKGQKDDRFDLIPAIPMRLVARHYGIGAKKYEDRNWERGYDWGLSIGALERHLNAFKAGEDIDEETGSPHLAAVVFHALALLEFGETHPELDNRAKRESATPDVDVARDATAPVRRYEAGQCLFRGDYRRLPVGTQIRWARDQIRYKTDDGCWWLQGHGSEAKLESESLVDGWALYHLPDAD